MAGRKGNKMVSERVESSMAKAVAIEADATNVAVTIDAATVEPVITELMGQREATLEEDVQYLPEDQDGNNDKEDETANQARG